MLISFKDWIAMKRHAKGMLKILQEDILSDDGFPDTFKKDEMLAYLKKQNASDRFTKAFCISYDNYKRNVIDKFF